MCLDSTVHRDRIEPVQKNYLIFALPGLPSYPSRLFLINLPFLANRRSMLVIVFINNLIQWDKDSDDLFSRLNFSVIAESSVISFHYYLPIVV